MGRDGVLSVLKSVLAFGITAVAITPNSLFSVYVNFLSIRKIYKNEFQ